MDDIADELAAKKREIEELVQENATLTEGVNNLEVCVGQLLKEVRFLRHIVNQAGNSAASCR